MKLLTALLTRRELKNSLTKPSEKMANKIAVLNNQRHKPQSCGFFMRNTSAPRYVGLGETVERLASSLGWYCNLIQPNTLIAVVVLGFITLPTEAVLMPKSYAQNHTKDLAPKLNVRPKSLFNIVKRTPKGNIVLFNDLTFDLAIYRIKQFQAPLVLKFSKMELIK